MLFDYRRIDPSFIQQSVVQAIAFGDKTIADLVSSSGPRTWSDTMLGLERVARRMAEMNGEALFPAEVAIEEDVRNVARAQQERVGKWQVELAFRDDLYAAFKAFAGGDEAAALHDEAKRLVDFWARDFRDAGHELEPAARAELKRLSERMVELSVRFSTNLAEYQDALVVTREDLIGLPDSYIDRLKPGDQPGTYRVTMDYPDVIPFRENSPRRDLRHQLTLKFNNRAVTLNRPILEEALEIRHRIAQLFGVPSWAHHRMKDKMAHNPETVARFYAGLIPALQSKAAEEIAVMSRLLEHDTGDGTAQAWDRDYYNTQQLKTDYGVDPMEVANYFPLGLVVDGMFSLTGEVFGLRYVSVDQANAWHPDVTMYRIHDASTDELLAYFYADLFPREGKFSHASAFSLVPAFVNEDGTRTVPVSAIVANFTKPTADSPSLLQHDEVLTLFHEFGHILHMSLSKARFTRFSAANTEWDFVEAPSQIMEHWCWKTEVLGRFASHHQTGESIPAALVERLVAARDLDQAVFKMRQVAYGQLDLRLHAPGEHRDLDEILTSTEQLTGFPVPEGTFYPANFGHLLGGYDAGYYGYLWAEVFGDDMFSRFEAEGVTNPAVGGDYRRKVLEPNGSKDAFELLRDFLKREPSNAAFLRKLGIDA